MDIAVFLPVVIEKHTTHTNESLLVYVPVISIYLLCSAIALMSTVMAR